MEAIAAIAAKFALAQASCGNYFMQRENITPITIEFIVRLEKYWYLCANRTGVLPKSSSRLELKASEKRLAKYSGYRRILN